MGMGGDIGDGTWGKWEPQAHLFLPPTHQWVQAHPGPAQLLEVLQNYPKVSAEGIQHCLPVPSGQQWENTTGQGALLGMEASCHRRHII
jgi:hypothetical protein